MLQIVAGQQIFEQVECRGIQPLQVVEEERERMFRSCEYADEPPKDQLKTSLRFRGGSSGTGGCSPMTCFNSGTRSTISSPFGSSASRSASRHLRNSSSSLLRSGRIKALKRLRQRGIRNVALVLVELA